MSYSIHSTLRDLLERRAGQGNSGEAPARRVFPSRPADGNANDSNADLLLPGGGAGGSYSGKIVGYRRRNLKALAEEWVTGGAAGRAYRLPRLRAISKASSRGV